MAFVYGDTYIANADMKDGLLIENQAMLNAGFKTGDKIISVDGTKIKFDNDINMKVVLGKRSLSKETEPNHKMPIDFIDQLSKFEKEPYWTSEGRLSLVRLLTSLPIKIYKPKML
jgi:regulator of sigma E protease